MKILENLNITVYTTESGENTYTGKNILDLAKGNLTYAELLLARADWQSIETLINDDLIVGEIIEFNEQYIITGGEENLQVINPESLLFQYADEQGLLSDKSGIECFNLWIEENL